MPRKLDHNPSAPTAGAVKPRGKLERVEALSAEDGNGRLGSDELMERVCQRPNLQIALRRARDNAGSPGIDGMTVEELPAHLKDNWLRLREELLAGDYQPQPVRRVVIPKPGGGERELGIPTVLDRFIQQALLQVLQPLFDPTFSDASYGFRPGRSAHQAVLAAQAYVQEGRAFVVDIDLEKFFDRVNHDILMGRLAKRLGDRRVLRLIRAYLNAGVLARRTQPRTAVHLVGEIPQRLAGLLPHRRDPRGVQRPRPVDPPSPAGCATQALEAWEGHLPRAYRPRRPSPRRQASCCQQSQLVAKLGEAAPPRPAESPLCRSWGSPACPLTST